MLKRKALFVALDSVPTVTASAEPPIPAIDDILGIIRDYGARGYVIVPVFGTDQGDDATLAAYADLAHSAMTLLRHRTGAAIATTLTLSGRFDPREVWDLARVYEIDLARSVLLTDAGRHAGLFRTAGVERYEELRHHPHAA